MLQCTSPYITVLDNSGNFGGLLIDSTKENILDPFTIQVDSNVPSGHIAQFKLICIDGTFIDTFDFSLPVAIYLADLEVNNGDFVPLPVSGAWQWGVPTSGSNNAHSGQKVWATVLGGNYIDNADWKLTSPEYTATVNNPQLKFWHWFSFEGTTTLYDGGNVKISTNNGQTWTVINPVGGYTGTAYSSSSGVGGELIYSGSSNGWVEATFNLPVNSGQHFLLRWHFGSDASVSTYAGWYIDDITGIGFAALPPPNNDVGVEAILSPGSYHFPNTEMTPVVKIKNFGALNQTNVPVVCSIVGAGSVLRYLNTQIVNINASDTLRVSFTSWTPTVNEVCTVKVRTNLPNDEFPDNDRKVQTTTISMSSQIIIGAATSNQRTEPLDRYYNYNTHEAIYLQSEIGVAGTIKKIAYYKESGSDLNPITPVAIYLKRTTDVTLPSGTYSLINYVQVYNGAFPNNLTSGWMEIDLATPFQYNNTDNLAVLILKGNQAYISSGYPYWRYTQTSSYLCRGARSDASQPTSLTATNSRPNIRLFMTQTGIEEPSNPTNPITITGLYAPRPNPLTNGKTQISFAVAEPGKVCLKIYDASGRQVKTLVDEFMGSGVKNIVWNCRDDNKKQVSEGIYFVTLETAKQKFSRKIVLAK